jgi:FkbM family methyltransferase
MNIVFKNTEEIRHVCEVGCFLPHTIQSKQFLGTRVKTTLIEPNPKAFEQLEESLGHYENVSLLNVAITDRGGQVKMYNRWDRADASCFVDSDCSPAILNDKYIKNEKDSFIVDSTSFDKIDNGDIDVLFVDTEGYEWFVIKNMKSRPKYIVLETHGAEYINPYMKNITMWMDQNGYNTLGKDGSDTLYGKN